MARKRGDSKREKEDKKLKKLLGTGMARKAGEQLSAREKKLKKQLEALGIRR